MSRLSGGASYAVTIGLWIGVNALNRYAESNPSSAVYIKPIVYLAIAAFLLTWVLTPLMDFYLLTNKYGKVLLDKKEKLMARLVGGALGTAIIGFVGSMLTGLDRFFLLGIVSIGLMIPFGSFLRPLREKQRQTLIIYTAVLLFIGIAGVISLNSLVLTGGVLALLGYQFLINGMTAKESGRTFGA